MNAARNLQPPPEELSDCSHFVHQTYQNAGYEYPYANSSELYAGDTNFARVRYPRAGDLIVWPGHVGIVVDPLQHSFYSLVSTGLDAQDYDSPYWKSRGIRRFYRYKMEIGDALTAANAKPAPRALNNKRRQSTDPSLAQRSPETAYVSNPPLKGSNESSAAIDRPLAAPDLADPAPAFEMPSSIVIAAGSRPPTRDEVVKGIFELSDAVGGVLRTDESLNVQLPIVVVENFDVDRVEVRHDHGWARVEIDARVSIRRGIAQPNKRREKVRWELRRGASGWEALTPADRVYVPYDVAVKNLAAQLARLTESDDAAAHQPAVLQRESRLASLLSTLLEPKERADDDKYKILGASPSPISSPQSGSSRQ